MPFLISTGLGLLAREIGRKLKPANNRGTPALTRGLYTAPKREAVRLRRGRQQQSADPFEENELRQRLGGYSIRRYQSTSAADQSENW
jgi:hypothetical protein